MRKNLIRAGAAVAISAGIAVGGASVASAEPAGTSDEYPPLTYFVEMWNEGGEMTGGGVARLVAAAWLHAPAAVLDAAHSAGMPG